MKKSILHFQPLVAILIQQNDTIATDITTCMNKHRLKLKKDEFLHFVSEQKAETITIHCFKKKPFGLSNKKEVWKKTYDNRSIIDE